jgi:hypothetical protein
MLWLALRVYIMEVLGSKLDFSDYLSFWNTLYTPKVLAVIWDPNVARLSWPSSVTIDSQQVKHVGMNITLVLMNRFDVTKQKLVAGLNERLSG